ncbi:MAG: apolipoprotein N-acyltransferase, partial [Actinomycetota bacterium]|nr:apolipoprotein N-acyltransferase [Actinomycetota bacterium]
QFAISRLRAIETGRSVLVAATNGISGVIGPDGTVLERTALGTQDVVVTSVVRASGRTMASRLRSWPEWVLSTLGAAGLGAAVVRRRDGTDG